MTTPRFPADRYRPRNTSVDCPTCHAEPGFCCVADNDMNEWPVQPHLVAVECAICGQSDSFHTRSCPNNDRFAPSNDEIAKPTGESHPAEPNPASLRELIATVRASLFDDRWAMNNAAETALSELESLVLPRREP